MRAGPGLPFFEVGAYRYTGEWLPSVGDLITITKRRRADRAREPLLVYVTRVEPNADTPIRVTEAKGVRVETTDELIVAALGQTEPGRVGLLGGPIRSRIRAVSMRRAAFIAAMAALAWAGVAGGAPTPMDRPTRRSRSSTTPGTGRRPSDGAWEHWAQGGNVPPGRSARTSTRPAARTRPGRPRSCARRCGRSRRRGSTR